jgi:hypothetical protein
LQRQDLVVLTGQCGFLNLSPSGTYGHVLLKMQTRGRSLCPEVLGKVSVGRDFYKGTVVHAAIENSINRALGSLSA